MALIKEPLEIDFEFEPRPLSKEDKQKISDYITAYKKRKAQKKTLKSRDTIKPNPKIVLE